MVAALETPALEQREQVAFRLQTVAHATRVFAQSAFIRRKGLPRLIERQPMTADVLTSLFIASLQSQRNGQLKLARSVIGGSDPSSTQWRNRPQPLLRGERMAAHHLLFDLRESQQQGLPARALFAAGTHGHDRGFEIAMRRDERIGSELIPRGTLETIQPGEAVEVVQEFLLRLRFDPPAPEWDGEIRLPVALQIAETLKGHDAAGHSQSRHRAGKIDRT